MSYQAGGDDGKSEAQPAADSKEVQHEHNKCAAGAGAGTAGARVRARRCGRGRGPVVAPLCPPAAPDALRRPPRPLRQTKPTCELQAIELSGKLEFENISLMYVRQASPEGISGA